MPVYYDFNRFIDNISSTVQILIGDKNIAFELIMQKSSQGMDKKLETICLYGDDVRLRQVLLNLLSNAIKFTNEGYIRLTVSFTDSTIKMIINDTGIGILPENLPILFDAFEQFNEQKNRGIEGTGLGLTISKRITEMMGGKIAVESVYGQGTSFHVEIPKILGNPALIDHIDEEEIAIYAPDAKILLVDDNVINLDVMVGLLRIYGIVAETATSGQKAINMLNQNQYDLVFMDHMMPKMDGIMATKIIREMGIDVLIIALTANAVAGAKEMMLNAGMNDYLSKPINRIELSRALKKWLPIKKLLNNPSEMIVSNETEDEKYKAFWDRIEQIDELSVSTGLDRVAGHRRIYEKTLKLMTQEIEKVCKNLNEFLLANDMDNFYIEVHGIKGALATIGAMNLSEKAFDLEIESGKKDAAFCAENLPRLLKRLNNLKLNLKEAFSIINANDTPFIIPPELPYIFERLISSFAEIDLVLIDEEIEKLNALNLSGALKEEIEQIKDLVMMMEYDEAKKRMSQYLDNQ